MEKQEIFKQLKLRFKNHTMAAKAIGVDPRLYRHWRSQNSKRKSNGPNKFALEIMGQILEQDAKNGNGDDA